MKITRIYRKFPYGKYNTSGERNFSELNMVTNNDTGAVKDYLFLISTKIKPVRDAELVESIARR